MFVFVFALCLRSFDLLFSVYVFISVCIGMFSFMPGAETMHMDIYVCITTVSMFLFLVCVGLLLSLLFLLPLCICIFPFCFLVQASRGKDLHFDVSAGITTFYSRRLSATQINVMVHRLPFSAMVPSQSVKQATQQPFQVLLFALGAPSFSKTWPTAGPEMRNTNSSLE